MLIMSSRYRNSFVKRVPELDIRGLREGREQDACCASQKRHQLHATALKRTLGWAKIADGRRIHGLRHIAALPLAGPRRRPRHSL